MKTCVLIMLVALLCAERAQGLRCYQCLGGTPETSCQPATCSYSNGVCVTQKVESIIESHKAQATNRFCLPECPSSPYYPESLQIMGATITSKISCCKEDLCNAAGPIGGSTWTLAGVLLFSLGTVFLQALL